MMTERDIEVEICEIENKIIKEKRSQAPSKAEISKLEIVLDTLKYILGKK